MLVAGVLLLWNVGRTVWLIVPHDDTAPALQSADAPGAAEAEASALGRLASLNLFGKTAERPISNATAAETSLNLTLVGSLALNAPDSSDARAFIADGRQGQAVYAPGDELPGGATLAEIHPDHVVLSFRGRRETLTLPELDGGVFEGGSREPRAGAAGRPGALAALRGGEAQRATNLQQVRARYQSNPGQLARDLQVLPYMEQGRLAGVRLRAGRDAALLQRLGLRTTDIITGVNGIALDDPDNAAKVLEQLNTATSFSVAVRRGGRNTTLNIDLNG